MFVLGQINPGLFAEFVHHPLNDGIIHIRTAQLRIAGGGKYIKGAFFAHFHNGYIQRTAAQVKHHYFLFFAGFINTESQRGGRRFVDQAHHFQSGDAAGVFGGLALVVVKISGYRDDGFFHRFAQKGLGVFFHFLQDESRQLLRRKFLPAQIVFIVFPHFAFESRYRAFRVGNRLPAGGFAHQALPVFGKSHIGRKRFPADRAPFGGRNNRSSASFHNRRGGVGSS